jgi:hypothetical protein
VVEPSTVKRPVAARIAMIPFVAVFQSWLLMPSTMRTRSLGAGLGAANACGAAKKEVLVRAADLTNLRRSVNCP